MIRVSSLTSDIGERTLISLGSLSIMQTPPSDTTSTPSKPLRSLEARPQIEYEITDAGEADFQDPEFMRDHSQTGSI